MARTEINVAMIGGYHDHDWYWKKRYLIAEPYLLQPAEQFNCLMFTLNIAATLRDEFLQIGHGGARDVK